ncbi:MAG: amidase [Gemmatimonadales bacterium]|nr:amidase [Gemmatimonadales bacterium]
MKSSVLLIFLCLVAFSLSGCGQEITHDQPLTPDGIRAAQAVLGLDLTRSERDLLQEELADQREALYALRLLDLPNSVPPALVLQPWPAGWKPPVEGAAPIWSPVKNGVRPGKMNDLAFASIGELAHLLSTRQVTSVELTHLFLERLKMYGPELECVISLSEANALRAAESADEEIAAGRYRGPLHGIPYGVKDLLAVRQTRTTWGAEPFRDQVIDDTATVVERLNEAGAVLVAKLTLGALAWGDVWFDGKTRNPWNLEEGSSGSSAGPASAVAAGLIPFALGSETWGSIVSPSTRCGVTGLRPTYGRVSRAGAMALSWSMDKLGPITRSAEDCAMVLDVIQGPDGLDPSVVEASFPYRPRIDLNGLRIGFLVADQDPERAREQELYEAALEALRGLGAELVMLAPLDFDAMPLSLILSVEAAAAFEQLTLGGRDDELVRQSRYAWPNVFRAAHFIPAVAYVQANRARWRLIELMGLRMKSVDLYVGPPFAGQDLLITNLTGHPSITLPIGMVDDDSPHSITFTGGLFDEATLLSVARVWQEETRHHLLHPSRYIGN